MAHQALVVAPLPIRKRFFEFRIELFLLELILQVLEHKIGLLAGVIQIGLVAGARLGIGTIGHATGSIAALGDAGGCAIAFRLPGVALRAIGWLRTRIAATAGLTFGALFLCGVLLSRVPLIAAARLLAARLFLTLAVTWLLFTRLAGRSLRLLVVAALTRGLPGTAGFLGLSAALIGCRILTGTACAAPVGLLAAAFFATARLVTALRAIGIAFLLSMGGRLRFVLRAFLLAGAPIGLVVVLLHIGLRIGRPGVVLALLSAAGLPLIVLAVTTFGFGTAFLSLGRHRFLLIATRLALGTLALIPAGLLRATLIRLGTFLRTYFACRSAGVFFLAGLLG